MGAQILGRGEGEGEGEGQRLWKGEGEDSDFRLYEQESTLQNLLRRKQPASSR